MSKKEKVSLNKDRAKALFWLGFLSVWRIVCEIVRVSTFFLFLIPMLLSQRVYEALQDFYYEPLEEALEQNNGDLQADRSEDESGDGHRQLSE